ncbi:zinc-ribbon domain-containing protein [Microcella sp.]|uniref:zinc-ribbon domain-containing protein n=1 Tax=Microcella sp. TaxID=1913979 RepID=UPI003F7161D4
MPAERTFPFSVRPLHRETIDSYTRRLLLANHEDPGLPKRLMRAHDAEGSESVTWLEVLAAKTGRGELHLEAPVGGLITHRDGGHCGQCAELTPARRLCTHCSHGAVVEQHAHVDSPVCRRHRRWVGFDAVPQRPVSPELLTAERQLRRVHRDGRYEHRIFLVLLRTLAPDWSAQSAAFPLAVRILQSVTSCAFLARLLDPSITYADAHRLLAEVVALHTSNQEVVRALWLSLRVVFASIHLSRHRGGPIPEPWAHAFPIAPELLASSSVAAAPFESFSGFLTAVNVTLEDAVDFEVQHHLLQLDPDEHAKYRTACGNGHLLLTAANRRRFGACQTCGHGVRPGINDIYTLAPRLVSEWDAEANGGAMPENFAAGSSEKRWWRCAHGHPFAATPSNRHINKSRCPVCMNRLIVAGVNDLMTTHPEIAGEIDDDFAPALLSKASDHITSFRCPSGHRYQRRIVDRVAGKGCLTCTEDGLRASKQSIVDTHPEVANEWHPWRNHQRKPEHFSFGSRETAWWLCPRGHAFESRIERRTRANYRCGMCSKREFAPGVNDLATTDPELVLEWHPHKNSASASELMSIDKLFWWKCIASGHEYEQTVDHRRKSMGCPQCDPADRVMHRA